MNDFVTSLIRTYTPIFVGAVVAWLAARGVAIDPKDAVGLTAFLTALFGGLYYLIVRLLERENPKIGVLLGVAKKPEYTEEVKK